MPLLKYALWTLLAVTVAASPSPAPPFNLSPRSTASSLFDRVLPAAFAGQAVRQLATRDERGPAGWNCSALPESSIINEVWGCTDPETDQAASCIFSSGAEDLWVCRPSSGCSTQTDVEWDLNLHIMAIFVVLVTSFLGCAIPLLALPYLSLKWPRRILFVVRHAGTGVFLSTAFVHLLYESFTDFSNPCLGLLLYQPAAPAIALASLLGIFLIDYSFARILKVRQVERRRKRRGAVRDVVSEGREEASVAGGGTGLHFCSTDLPALSSSPVPKKERFDDPELEAQAKDDAKQARIDVYMLEGGIFVHSVMIGVSLGAGGGPSWLTIFIAIVFHQTFEGLGLSSRIAMLEWDEGQGWRKWMLVLIFASVTPFGMAIGAGAHASYNPNSPAALLSVAILNSISAGILLWAGIVELLVHDFLHGELSTAPWSKVCVALVSLLVGAAAMSAIGKWA